MTVKLATLVADRVDQLALPVNLRDISFSYFVNLYVESPVLLDLHGLSKLSNRILDYLDHKFYFELKYRIDKSYNAQGYYTKQNK